MKLKKCSIKGWVENVEEGQGKDTEIRAFVLAICRS